jgi:hypothetical protein
MKTPRNYRRHASRHGGHRSHLAIDLRPLAENGSMSFEITDPPVPPAQMCQSLQSYAGRNVAVYHASNPEFFGYLSADFKHMVWQMQDDGAHVLVDYPYQVSRWKREMRIEAAAMGGFGLFCGLIALARG